MLRSLRIWGAALAAFSIMAVGVRAPVFAATQTTNIAVSATVVKNCVFGTGAAIAFGNYDPVGAQAAANLDVASTGFSVACTKGTPYSVSLDLGANPSGTVRRMKGATPTNFLTYEIYNDSGHSVVWNSANPVAGTAASKASIALTAYGRVASGQDAAVDTYTDTVVATVTF